MSTTQEQLRPAPMPSTRAGLARQATTVAASKVRERWRPQPARELTDVPGSAQDLTTDWLTAVLCRDVPGAQVTEFATPGGSSGTSERVALRLRYNDVGVEAGLPTELYLKLTASFRQRMILGGAGAIAGEATFFRHFRPRVEMKAPRGYWGAADTGTWKSVAVMEDIAASKGAVFSRPTTPMTRAQLEDLLQNLARCHGAFWDDPELPRLRTPEEHFRTISTCIAMEARCRVGMKRARAVLAKRVDGEAGRLWEGTRRALTIATDAPRTLLHGDLHVGQTYETADGRMGLADWQIVLQGGWSYDFAYLVSTACEPEDRRAWERDLLEFYLDHLVEHGGRPPGLDEAWTAYCQLLFYPYTAWAFTIGRAAYQPRMQPESYCLAVLRRVSAAIEDNDAFRTVGL
ncbi:phosphotransferase [Sporichthya brevicatena]|uniref:Phosphotransferase n=1 Tax=Sporichthya brevicatena TaxID=171442 RepID=A0ABN1GP62_9ACTN